MIEIKRYDVALKEVWNQFVSHSRNGTFLLQRDYMDYHADRFDDYSLLFYSNNRLIALLPANRSGEVLYSHQGLTYGGLVMGMALRGGECIRLFEALVCYLKMEGFVELHYKPIPTIYHNYPCEEDRYALFRMGAQTQSCNLSSAIDRREPTFVSKLRTRGAIRARKAGFEVKRVTEFAPFWELLTQNLTERFGVLPVHSLTEIEQLATKFPNHIELYGAFKGDTIHAGCLLYITDRLIHVQYISADKTGKIEGALDLLFLELIEKLHIDCPYFEFGQSTEQGGVYLNEGLLTQKEGFGGRGVVYEGFVITL